MQRISREWRNVLLVLSVACVALPGLALAETPNHPENPPSHDEVVAALESGGLSLDDARRMGLSVFTTPFNRHDGMGDGPFDAATYERHAATLWDYLRAIQPYLWKGGEKGTLVGRKKA